MTEKITLQWAGGDRFGLTGELACSELNPKALLLYAAAKCAGLTALHIMEKQRVQPLHFTIGMSGVLSTDTVQSESMYLSFHILYEVTCTGDNERGRIEKALQLTQQKHCSMVQMLGRIAPVSYDIRVLCPASVMA